MEEHGRLILRIKRIKGKSFQFAIDIDKFVIVMKGIFAGGP